MQIKFIEIRDSLTCIPAVALRMTASDATEDRFMRRCGFGQEYPAVILMRLSDQKATCDLYEWHSLGLGLRTMQNAHDWIERNWDAIESGQVVDVEFILGERDQPKTPEIGMSITEEVR